MSSVERLRKELRRWASPRKAAILQGFFKTGPGGYGEGDRFLGVTVPRIRALVRQYSPFEVSRLPALIRSPLHEERLLGLLLLVDRFQKGPEADRRRAGRLYLKSFRHIDNWDLVDATAPLVVGALGLGPGQLLAWASSRSLWTRRIAIVSTLYAIRQGRFGDTLRVAKRLLGDPEDLIHKATGWMLREVGKRDTRVLEAFLRRHHRSMPRTMLRYAIERFPGPRRRAWLAGRRPPHARERMPSRRCRLSFRRARP